MRFNPDTERGITLQHATPGPAPAVTLTPTRVEWRSPYSRQLRHQWCSSRREALELVKFYEDCGTAAQIAS